MRKIVLALGMLGALSIPAANGAVYELAKCQLKPGKTFEDLFEFRAKVDAWEKKQKLGTDPGIILFEFFGEERLVNGYFILFKNKDFRNMGEVLGKLWDDGAALASGEELGEEPGICTQNRMFWTSPAQQ